MAKSKDDDTPIPSKKKGSKSTAGTSSRGPSQQMMRLMLGTRLFGVLLGGLITVFGMMALVGMVTDNFLIRLLSGLVVAVALPAFVADRLLKKTNMGGGLPMVADVFAIALLGIALVFVSADFITKPLFIREGDRYARSGSTGTARLVYWIGGVSPLFPADKGLPPDRLGVCVGLGIGEEAVKRYLSFFIVAVMTLGLLFLLFTKPRTAYDAPAEIPEPKETPDGGADAALDAAVAIAAEAGPPKPAIKTIRVATLGWELAAPGVSPAGGDDAGATMALELAPETALEAVEARLAKGSADPAGADVAVMPLPAFVSSFDRMRAIEPRAFLVVGFSRGREEVHAAQGALLKPPPGADEVKVIALAPPTASDPTARAGGSESATLTGLFALDLLGVAPSRVRFLSVGSADAKGALLAAVVRGVTDERKLAFSTTEASHLVPIVAVAPKAQLDKSGDAQLFARAWLEGLARTKADASGIARRLATKDNIRLAAGVGGAPETIALVDRLGQIDAADAAMNGAYIGEGVKSALTLETILQRTWQLERAGGLTSVAAPDPLPIDNRIAKAIGITAPPPPAPAPAPEATDGGKADAGSAFAPVPTGATAFLVYRAPTDSSAEAVATQIAFLAGIFDHAAFRISAKGGDKAARAIATEAADKHAVPRARLATVATDPGAAFASVEILALP